MPLLQTVDTIYLELLLLVLDRKEWGGASEGPVGIDHSLSYSGGSTKRSPGSKPAWGSSDISTG